MNPLDWLLALFVVYSIVRAALRGLVRELFALGGLILGFLLACWYYPQVAFYLRGLVNSAALAEFCAFLLIVSVVMVAATLVGALIRRAATAIGLSPLDRLGGAAFGLLRGVILATAFLLAVTAFLPAAPWVQQSRFSPYLLRASHAVSFVMPRQLKQRFTEGLDRMKHTTPDWINYGSLSHTD